MFPGDFSTLKINGVPEVWDAPEYKCDGLRALFYSNTEYHGKPTRAFAWVGFPEGASPEHPVPGIVLVHGGGGTAFSDWVKMWNAFGFAAIAMDNCGSVPSWHETPYFKPKWPKHPYSGPGNWGLDDYGEANITDHWPYQATASVLGAFELLRSYPQVKADEIGITGISWGGFLTCIAASLEPRFRFAIPIYGCGGWANAASSLCNFKEKGKRASWLSHWDPDLYLPNAKMPFLWFTDAEDVAYSLDCFLHSASLTKNPGTRLSVRTDYAHDHTTCRASKTIPAFAKGVLAGRVFPDFGTPYVDGDSIACSFTPGDTKIVSSELKYTRASGAFADFRWRLATTQMADGVIKGIPMDYSRHAFFQMRDEDGCLWSSRMIDL